MIVPPRLTTLPQDLGHHPVRLIVVHASRQIERIVVIDHEKLGLLRRLGELDRQDLMKIRDDGCLAPGFLVQAPVDAD